MSNRRLQDSRLLLSRRAAGRLALSLPLALAGCAAGPAGRAPGAPLHHTADGFRNPPGSPVRGGDFGDWMGFFWRNMNRADDVALPRGHVVPEVEALRQLAGASRDGVTWLGHACFLIRQDGWTILTDPFLAEHASPLPPLGPRRFAPPGVRPSKLPPVDLLLISHNHYDHLDLATLRALPDRRRIQVVSPLRLGSYFRDLGYERVLELDWQGRYEIPGLRIAAVPAIHFSKRSLFDRNRTLWCGFLIESRGRRIYFAGDTAYGPMFAELGRELAPLDLALVPVGAYEPRQLMRASHATPEEAVRIGRDLGARRLVAMHWGTIQLTDEPPFEPPERFRAAARAAGYGDDDAWVMAIGETRPL
jgi:N-acyl-phosphatidylethanolamine-hydrolysing phospholipase D